MPNQTDNTPTSSVESGVSMNQAFKLVVIVAALFALLYVAMLLSNNSKQRTNNQSQEAVESDLPYEQVNVPTDKLPSLFPSDIPVEEGAEVLENSSLTSEDGDLQANRRFISQKSPAENYALYLNYLRDSGWEITNQSNGTAQKLLRAKNGYQTLMVTIELDPTNDTTQVALIFSESHQ